MKKTLGNRIRELRDKKDLSLREFAKHLDDISAAHLSDIEHNRRFPSEQLLKKMAAVLDIPVKELEELDTRPPIADMRRLIDTDPAFGFAFRRLVDKDVSPNDILDLTKKKPDRNKS